MRPAGGVDDWNGVDVHERRTPIPAPAAPQCAICARHEASVAQAEKERDYSRASDERVLLARHQRDAHRGAR